MPSASELRFDLVSKDWVVIATGRAKRPGAFAESKRQLFNQPESDCPFCHLPEATNGEKVLLTYYKKSPETATKPEAATKNDWSVMVIPNKFPAFAKGDSLNERAVGPYSVMDGVGFHEIVVTRDHRRQMAEFSTEEVDEVLNIYQERYLELMNEKFVNYVSIFHNHGREAGATVSHPHSQIIAIPVTDPDLRSSLDGSKRFMETQGKCVHCAVLEWEREACSRVIYENEKFIVVTPFASRVSFETRIYPKEHKAYFERIKEDEKIHLADALRVALYKIFKGLNDPAYNFFLHTAPCDGKNYDHYHWHFEILPKTATWAGFELGTGIEMSAVQ